MRHDQKRQKFVKNIVKVILFLNDYIEANANTGGLFPGCLACRAPPGSGVEEGRRQEKRAPGSRTDDAPTVSSRVTEMSARHQVVRAREVESYGTGGFFQRVRDILL